jgi:hypothetical protein
MRAWLAAAARRRPAKLAWRITAYFSRRVARIQSAPPGSSTAAARRRPGDDLQSFELIDLSSQLHPGGGHESLSLRLLGASHVPISTVILLNVEGRAKQIGAGLLLIIAAPLISTQ